MEVHGLLKILMVRARPMKWGFCCYFIGVILSRTFSFFYSIPGWTQAARGLVCEGACTWACMVFLSNHPSKRIRS